MKLSLPFYQCLSGMLILLLQACNGQIQTQSPVVTQSGQTPTTLIGGGCDGCKLMYIGMPARIHSIDTSAGWTEAGQKLLVTGIVYKRDGKTPAPNVILYYWQTDKNGYYSPRLGMDERTKPHGHIRGWVKTDAQGRYAIHTIRPAPYPKEDMPAHIHVSVREPDLSNEYYIDDLVFDDDKLLTTARRKTLENRGGSGIMRVLLLNKMQVAEHTIVLGLNIPNYPKNNQPVQVSGLEIGEDSPSFIPYHAYGPDKGSQACPVCNYGRYHGILYFVGNHPDWEEIKRWLVFLEEESRRRQKYLKVYFVYGNGADYAKSVRQKELEHLGRELNLTTVALTFVPSLADTETEVNLNKINPGVSNTFVIYKHRRIIDKYIDWKPTAENFQKLRTVLDRTTNDYFALPEPEHD